MSNRAIDRHEDQIVNVLELTDGGWSYEDACGEVARASGLTIERLSHLVNVWCAVGGFEVPQ